MKNKLLIIVPVVLVLLIGLWSSFSYDRANVSDLLERALPHRPGYTLLDNISFTWAGTKVSIYDMGYYRFLDWMIRKITFFLLFGVFGLFLFLNFRRIKEFSEFAAAFYAIFATAVYSNLDEIHQHFVDGRDMSLTDTVLKSTGALLFITIAFLVLRKRRLQM
ncbi:VanZ family protein [Pseudolactococcus insecticola]|uniref:VanZ-like domain-containing protein n=1 Tax=Pseudolactococcus insecticola TaxID=2709158 RepID=A0A6A0B9Q3_9LACT|nr:VanZ family protein [Lactococcus insecticola]GFH41168.1 hypothetical protein Hs20B_15660 [Lactococcus insecticola]